jgi:hypothetical protein
MNRLTALCCVAVVMMVMAGCERKGQSSAPYDPKKSPPPSAINVKEDPGLLADQAALSSAAERAKPATNAPSATTDTPVTPETTAPAATTDTPVTPTTASPAATTDTPVTPETAAPAASTAGDAVTTPAS